MTYARDAWNAERASWRSVIQLNLVRSIITIVETLQAEMAGDHPESDSPRHFPALNPKNSSISMNSVDVIPQQSTTMSSLLNGKHQLLQLRLGPLRRVEADLKKRFGAQADEDDGRHTIPLGSLGLDFEPQAAYKEFGVSRLTEALSKSLLFQKIIRGNEHNHGKSATIDNVVDEVTEVIASCKDDMVALWSDPAVRTVLKKWNIHMEDSAGL